MQIILKVENLRNRHELRRTNLRVRGPFKIYAVGNITLKKILFLKTIQRLSIRAGAC